MEWSGKKIAAIGLILTLIGIVTPMIWDSYIHQSELEFRIDSLNSIFPDDPLLKDFMITYQGKPIKNLTRMDCAFINSGKTPITSEDIITEPKIIIPRESGIIAAILLSTDPRNLYADFPLNSSLNEITIKFNLLNPDDIIRLAIYLNGTSNELPTINARIKGVKEIQVVNNLPNLEKDSKQKKLIEKLIIIFKYVGIIILIIFIIFSGKQAIDFRKTRNQLKKNPKLLNEFNNFYDFKKFIDKNLAALGSGQKKLSLAKEMEDAEKDFSEENKTKLISAIVRALEITSASESAFIFFILILICIFAYLYWPIFS